MRNAAYLEEFQARYHPVTVQLSNPTFRVFNLTGCGATSFAAHRVFYLSCTSGRYHTRLLELISKERGFCYRSPIRPCRYGPYSPLAKLYTVAISDSLLNCVPVSPGCQSTRIDLTRLFYSSLAECWGPTPSNGHALFQTPA